jgi:hypothetical protein
MNKVILALVAVSLFGCSVIPHVEGAQHVKLVDAAPAGCEKLVHISTTSSHLTAEDILRADQILIAKNEAVRQGVNTLVQTSYSVGSGEFDGYICH